MSTTPLRTALVTGGSRGIGRASAHKLAEAGSDVILTYRDGASRADTVVHELRDRGRRAHALRLDVTDTSAFADFTREVRSVLADQWGAEGLDVLVNNAGSVVMGPFTAVTETDFDLMINTHLRGVFFLTQHLLPLMPNGGRIINISSAVTRFTEPGMAAYTSGKAAVEALTRSLAKELGPRGITVNAVAAGATATDFAGGFARHDEAAAAISGMSALGRVGQPEDIAGVVATLAGPETAWITGQRIEASGGMLL